MASIVKIAEKCVFKCVLCLTPECGGEHGSETEIYQTGINAGNVSVEPLNMCKPSIIEHNKTVKPETVFFI